MTDTLNASEGVKELVERLRSHLDARCDEAAEIIVLLSEKLQAQSKEIEELRKLNEWMPIETAPRGKRIDLLGHHPTRKPNPKLKRVTDCCWNKNKGYWTTRNCDNFGYSQMQSNFIALYWRHVPTPPKEIDNE